MGDVFKQKYKSEDGSRVGESRKWYGEYTDHTGKRRRVPLSTDKTMARAMLAELIRQAERRRVGLDDDFTESARSPICDTVDAYLADLELRGRGERHRTDVERILDLVLTSCKFNRPGDLSAEKLDAYLAGLSGSARTRATHRQTAVAFGNWLVRKGKLPANPLARATKPEGEIRRKRRALSADELRRLVAAAKDRPLREATLIRWGPRTGQYDRQLKPKEVDRLIRKGRHNALLYRTAFYTGLRADELRSLWAGDLTDLDGENPRLWLPGERTKNGKDARLPLPRSLATDIKDWIRSEGIGPGEPLFRLHRDSTRELKRDLAAAGIEYRDKRGRYADFHALRGSLSSHLNAAGVPITAAKNMMRHGTITLTADTYHDEAMDDLRGAIDKLPEV